MKLEVAQKIKQVADDGFNESIELMEDYSGRGMYGETTAAITVSHFSVFVQAVAQAAIDVAQDHDCECEEFVEALGNLRQDSLGHDIVIY